MAAPGATLTVRAEPVQGAVELTCSLDRATASWDDWRAAGLSFWVARQVFAEHDATLEMPVLAELARGEGAAVAAASGGGEPDPTTERALVGGASIWRLRLPVVA